MLDDLLPLKEKAQQACDIRVFIRKRARDIMADEGTRKELDREKPHKTLQELIQHKIEDKGLTEEEAYLDVIKTACKTNEAVNKQLGLQK